MKFDNQVIVITGAGAGLGKAYALYFASKGAKVVVNDLGTSSLGTGTDSKSADLVVNEIRKNGGTAVANYDSVENGENIIQTALNAYGKVDVLINNAGILRDKSFKKMTKQDWDLIIRVHLNGMFACTKAVYPHFLKQNSGRIINITSQSGLYGSFGQANYSMAKAGIIGFTKTLAKESEKYGIKVNAIAPIATTRMTEGLLSQELQDLLKVEYVIPVIAYLAHESCEESGSIFEVAASWVSKVRNQRSEGVFFGSKFTEEDLKERIDQVCDFNRNCTNEDQSTMEIIVGHAENYSKNKSGNKLASEEVFELITNYLNTGEGESTVSKISSIYQFDILEKKGGKPVKTWTIDMKNGKGSCKEGKPEKYDALFTMVDQDFVKVCSGQLNPQMAFINGKMKIKGNMRKATMFTPDLFPKPTEENRKKYSGMKPKF